MRSDSRIAYVALALSGATLWGSQGIGDGAYAVAAASAGVALLAVLYMAVSATAAIAEGRVARACLACAWCYGAVMAAMAVSMCAVLAAAGCGRDAVDGGPVRLLWMGTGGATGMSAAVAAISIRAKKRKAPRRRRIRPRHLRTRPIRLFLPSGRMRKTITLNGRTS